MPFRRRRVSGLQTQKHEITTTLLAADLSTITNLVIAKGTAAGTVSAENEVTIGHRVKWIILEFNVGAETITNPKVFHWYINFKPIGRAASATPAVYGTDDKRLILQRGMEMLPKNVSTIFKRKIFIPIPKKYQRIGEDDEINFGFVSTLAETVNFCCFIIYKEEW